MHILSIWANWGKIWVHPYPQEGMMGVAYRNGWERGMPSPFLFGSHQLSYAKEREENIYHTASLYYYKMGLWYQLWQTWCLVLREREGLVPNIPPPLNKRLTLWIADSANHLFSGGNPSLKQHACLQPSARLWIGAQRFLFGKPMNKRGILYLSYLITSNY